MQNLFQHKHQRLILQCYPAGKAVDKKANSSELSYLLYYASSRRVKLEKVITFLKERTDKDAYRNRAGNLQVTLQIVKGLIEKCSGNLNVFAQQVCDILQTVLDTQDVALCKNAIKTFAVLCEKSDGPLFTGDKTFVLKFTQLSQTFISFGTKKTGPNQYEWQMISLMAINHVSKCLGHSSAVSGKLISMSIPMLTQAIKSNNSQTGILTRLKLNVNDESVEDRRLSRVVSAKTQQDIARQIDEDFANDALTLDDITEQAYTCMAAFFNTTSTSQIWEVTKAVVQNNIDSRVDLEWGITFLELCVSWTPVQLRFISLSSLLSTLTRLTNDASKSANYNIRYQYARHLLGLLSSTRVNMIGLSVADIIQQLLTLQTDLFLKINKFTREQCNTLTGIYSDCMCNLATHIYYHDQVPDSIQEILSKVDGVLADSFTNENQLTTYTGEQVFDLIIQLLDNITKIFQILKSSSSTISRNHVTLEHWDISLGILAPHQEFPEKHTILTDDHINTIQLKFLEVFDDFLNNELAVQQKFDSTHEQSSPRDSVESLNNSNDEGNDYLTPNINQYIFEQQNFISHFLMYVDKFLDNNVMGDNLKVITTLVKVVKNMVNILGLNLLSNFIPFFHHWQLNTKNALEVAHIQKFKDTFAYIVFYYIVESLDGQYSILEDYCRTSKLFQQLFEGIEYRKKHKLWIYGIGSIPTEFDNANGNKNGVSTDDIIIFRIKKSDIEAFACESNFLIQWLYPLKPLITEIDKALIGTGESRNNDLEFAMPISPSLQPEYDQSSPRIASVSPTSASFNSEKGLYTGLGLGTAGDITSIHNEIYQNSQRSHQKRTDHNSFLAPVNGNGFGGSAGGDFSSLYTSDSKGFVRVSDLREVISSNTSLRRPSFQLNDHATKHASPGSVLTRNIMTTHVDSILDELDSEDDSAVVV
ncbi:uncharacterized protein SPAPADRAFT_56898 [Spathaspora passalidarum NRRL Y-27907]|uniref:Protein EFR3 n=1 Tax=Spathaspora passalidarum (strain NRRL Y-27907 / 11-Y1) TaxID=619300 RepID=G3ATK1_SPAPN|nr:uncharacterized protein SPAPADRAFT_56898 [Spathaspora passalidarum NRRL Y-27907]EGW30964.1 hypothetical protein SPAPADRAFT_56898 [Spathaspora passalidarum NRRL Y-27907]